MIKCFKRHSRPGFLFFFNLLLLLESCYLLVGCQQAKTRDLLPPWVTKAQEICPQSELCGVGSSTSLKDADMRARSELASFFMTRVTEQLTSEVHSQSENQSMSTQMSDQSFLQVQVDEVLSGSFIAERYIQGDLEFYSLAKIKKQTLLNSWQSEEQRLRSEAKETSSLKGRFALLKLKDLEIKAHQLQLLRALVTGTGLNKNLIDIYQSELRKPGKVFVSTSWNSPLNVSLEVFLAQKLMEVGHQVEKEKSNAKYLLNYRIEILERRLVATFTKVKARLHLVGLDKENIAEPLGVLQWEEDFSARSEEQLREKILEKIKMTIQGLLYQTGI